jgi:hypothetical protein
VTLAEAQAALLARGFDYLVPAQTTLMLNVAKDTFEDVYEWPWLWLPFSGPTPLTVPNLKLVLTVQGNGTELLGLDIRQVAQDGSDLTQAGTPGYWWIEGTNKLHAWPGDGAVLSGVCLQDSPALSLPTDTPLIPSRYHGLWIDFAVVEAYKDSDNYAAAQALRADIYGRLPDIIGRYEVRNRQHSMLIGQRLLSEDE